MINDCIKKSIGVGEGRKLGGEVAVVEGEVWDAELGQEFEAGVDAGDASGQEGIIGWFGGDRVDCGPGTVESGGLRFRVRLRLV